MINGWPNNQTYIIFEWLCKQIGVYDLAVTCIKRNSVDAPQEIKSLVEDYLNIEGSWGRDNLSAQLLSSAISAVNWRAIRDRLISDDKK